MQHVRFEEVHRQLPVMQQKVYAQVSLQESWSIDKIYMEYARQKISSADRNSIAHSLYALADAKLIRETSQGYFIKNPITPPHEKTNSEFKKVAKMLKKENQKEVEATVEKTRTPIDVLASLSKRAMELSLAMKTLALDIDNAALELEQQIGDATASKQKWEQLNQLLRG